MSRQAGHALTPMGPSTPPHTVPSTQRILTRPPLALLRRHPAGSASRTSRAPLAPVVEPRRRPRRRRRRSRGCRRRASSGLSRRTRGRSTRRETRGRSRRSLRATRPRDKRTEASRAGRSSNRTRGRTELSANDPLVNDGIQMQPMGRRLRSKRPFERAEKGVAMRVRRKSGRRESKRTVEPDGVTSEKG